MSIQTLAMVFQSFTALILLVVLLLWLVPAYRLDKFRQDLFELRDELFDYAASGNIEFDDPSYRLLRQLANGFIQYAHELTGFRVIMMSLGYATWHNKPKMEWSEKWNKSLQRIQKDEVRERLCQFHARVCNLVLWRLVTSSPILIGMAILVAVVLLCQMGIKSLKDVISRALVETTARVIDPQLLEEQAARAAV